MSTKASSPAQAAAAPSPGAGAAASPLLSTRPLTGRQQEILELIKQHIARTGYPPTRAEIASALGFRSPNAAEEHLKALARKGVIDIMAGASRGIRLAEQMSTQMSEQVGNAVKLALSLPLIGRVAAGSPILAQEHVEAHYALDPSLFSASPDYLLKVRGMSMRDAGILDGDLLAVKQANDARNGQIVVARIGDAVTVKRWRKSGTKVELIAENPDYKTIQLDTRIDEFSLEGIAVGLVRSGKGL